MSVVLNLFIVGAVLFIAFWWANQGVFSALLHLLCVIAAGAIALALWEPVTVGVLLRGTGFDDYAWGISLIMIFVISLLLLRISIDRMIKANVDLSHGVNMAFGGILGIAAGILTVGILVIGCGFVQSTREILGFSGMVRSGRTGEVFEESKLWVPVHQWTYAFYSQLSVTSLSTGQSLRQYYPNLHFQAVGLQRDSWNDGRGKTSLTPSAARIEELLYSQASNRYAVKVKFESQARDYGEQVTLSSAQVRLIGHATGRDEANVAYPDAWRQYSGRHRFDDVSHYITTEPGQQAATVTIEFDARQLNGQPPRFIQIRGTRFLLPKAEGVGGDQLNNASATPNRPPANIPSGGSSIQQAIEQTNSIRPITASTNLTPAGIEVTDDRFIRAGDGEFRRGGARPSRGLMIQGIFEPASTRIIQLDVSRGQSVADIYSGIQNQAGPGAVLELIDSAGRTYKPIGYIHARPDQTTRINIDFVNFFETIEKLPSLPSSADHNLKLLFCITEGATIVSFRFGDVTVGSTNLTVRDPKARSAPTGNDSEATGGAQE